jgi:hypothetical protein
MSIHIFMYVPQTVLIVGLYRNRGIFMLAIASTLQARCEEYLRNQDREVGVPIAYRFTSRSQLIFRCPLSSGSSSLPRVRLTLFADEFHASEVNSLLLSSTRIIPHHPGTARSQRCANNHDIHPYDQEPDPQGSQELPRLLISPLKMRT